MSDTSSQELGKLIEALSKVQSVMEGAREDSDNPYFKSRYADLTSVWQACRKPLTDNGLAVMQSMECIGDKTCLVTILGHSSGQWIKSVLPIPITKPDAQSLGSAITYCRRYALAAIVGVCPMDDDAEAAMDRPSHQSKGKVTPLPQKPASVDNNGALKNLKNVLDSMGDEVNINHLNNFILYLATERERQPESIVKSALISPEMTERFKSSYQDWLKKPPQLTVAN